MNRLTIALVSLLMGCGDPTVSIGSHIGPIEVSPSAVRVPPSDCPIGYEHANICCTGDNGKNASACVTYLGTPFHPCAAGWLTYPNTDLCCSIDNPETCKSCEDCANEPGASRPPNAAAPACSAPQKCPPGSSPDLSCMGFGCWSYVSRPGGGPPAGSGFCTAPADGPLNGRAQASCSPVCPSNWFQSDEPDVCCGRDARGRMMCFVTSQFVGPVEDPITGIPK